MRIILLAILTVFVLYVGSCTALSSSRSRTFDAVHPGDLRESVVQAFGKPDVVEIPGQPFTRYASAGCSAPCAERLWYENRLSLDTQAWSFEINAAGVVIQGTRWTSP
ncbi:hypothetical protein [Stenotrophomonas maltophilia]|uniref:hypothetical protein n=1 Tax=Stenotrophomonas maltophilia TaxID=40324 RepID=UPI0013DA2E1B|nr:hypothetical protein [Stenotrophomonas maltophilia]